jgi:hypothetical protein
MSSSLGTANLNELVPGSLRSIHFFNGRLLTAEDLTAEQLARRTELERLGRVAGSGVVYGLQVTETPVESTRSAPVVRIEPGLALNRNGTPLELASPVDVPLVGETARGSADGAEFDDCLPLDPGHLARGAGVYVLTIGAASALGGRAPIAGLAGDAACNQDYSMEGVRFRLLQVDPGLEFDSLLRSSLAHEMFGTRQRLAATANPFALRPERFGLRDDVEDKCLQMDEVPLAVLYWTAAAGIRFVDVWAVRRPVFRPSHAQWPMLLGDRLVADAEAMFHQFADHLDDLLQTAESSRESFAHVTAARHFAFLPPVGIVPVLGAGSRAGLDSRTFFGRQGTEPETLDAAYLRDLLLEGLRHEPIEVGGAERIQLYHVWENVEAVESGDSAQLALVFAKHTIPYRGTARYGYAHYGSSRYGRPPI